MGFLQFTEIVDASQEKKTKTWGVLSTSGDSLGYAKWHSAWRRYAFFPETEVLFDAECLTDVARFLSSETDKQKLTWK